MVRNRLLLFGLAALLCACGSDSFAWPDVDARLAIYQDPGGTLKDSSAGELWNALLDAHYTRIAVGDVPGLPADGLPQGGKLACPKGGSITYRVLDERDDEGPLRVFADARECIYDVPVGETLVLPQQLDGALTRCSWPNGRVYIHFAGHAHVQGHRAEVDYDYVETTGTYRYGLSTEASLGTVLFGVDRDNGLDGLVEVTDATGNWECVAADASVLSCAHIESGEGSSFPLQNEDQAR